MRLTVARHGQTEWNAEGRVCGITDIQLSNQGIEQARELSTKLADLKVDIIISSPLIRARRTAEIISRALGKDIRLDNRLIEQDYGIYEGVSRNNLEFIEAKKQFAARLGGGESLLQVAHRVYQLIEETDEEYPTEHVLFITHGSVCRVIHTYYHNLSNGEYDTHYTNNCEMEQYHM